MIKVWSIPPSNPLHPWGVGGLPPPLLCAFRRRVLCSKPPFPVQMGGTYPSHVMRDTPHHSEEVTPYPPCSGSKVHPPPTDASMIMRVGYLPPNPHPIYGSYIFRRIPWNLRISFQDISKNPPLLLVLFQNFLKNPLDSSRIPFNISKNPEVSSHHLSIHVQFHRKFGQVTG
jgi:hypothetical protein